MTPPRIDYVELPSVTAHELTRVFYAKAFGWTFADYGPDYAATEGNTVDVGLNGQPDDALSAPLPIVRVDDLEVAFEAVVAAGGLIARQHRLGRAGRGVPRGGYRGVRTLAAQGLHPALAQA